MGRHGDCRAKWPTALCAKFGAARPALLNARVTGRTVSGGRDRRARKRIKALRLARDGERAVAELLDGMRETGYRVFHDLVGPGFNVDHVLVGRHGLFLVGTKTISKPATGAATVRYDGESVRVGGF